jgi:hypothetical protein
MSGEAVLLSKHGGVTSPVLRNLFRDKSTLPAVRAAATVCQSHGSALSHAADHPIRAEEP